MWPYRKQHLRIKSCTRKYKDLRHRSSYSTSSLERSRATSGRHHRRSSYSNRSGWLIVSRSGIIYLTKSSGFHHRRSRSFLQHRRQRRGRSERCGPPFRTCSTLCQLRRRILLQQRHQHQGSRGTTAKHIFNIYSGGSAMERRTM
jgi:hypothetical protein